MSGLYRNPISPLVSLGTTSVPIGSTYGSNFSVYGVGGFMEVYNLSDLVYTIPSGQTGTIEYSGNTIPIRFQKGSGSVFSPDVLTLNSDNISSGRRRLGMLVYVYETDKIYQFTIPNYETLWNNATGATGPGGSTVIISDFGTTIKNNSVAGQNLINSWTASTIEGSTSGVTGYSWTELKTGGGQGSGISTFTYSSNTLTILDVTGGTYSVTINNFTGLTINGSLSATTYNGNGSGLTNIPISGVTNLQSSLDNKFDKTGGTINGGLTANTISATTYQNLPVSGLSGGQNISVTGSNGNFTITFTGTTGSNFTGGTVTGATFFSNGLSANTISATTYLNLPVSGLTQGSNINVSGSNGNYTISFTGGNVSYPTNFTNGLTANTLNITGNSQFNGTIQSNSLTGTTDRLVQVNSGGTLTAVTEVFNAYIFSGSAIANLLENDNNWDINGDYTGTTITGSYQGQRYYNNDYFYEAVLDNLFIRMIRG